MPAKPQHWEGSTKSTIFERAPSVDTPSVDTPSVDTLPAGEVQERGVTCTSQGIFL